jgi:hypothetical protein
MTSVVPSAVAVRLMLIAAAMTAAAGERGAHRGTANHDTETDRNRNLTDLTHCADPGKRGLFHTNSLSPETNPVRADGFPSGRDQ